MDQFLTDIRLVETRPGGAQYEMILLDNGLPVEYGLINRPVDLQTLPGA